MTTKAITPLRQRMIEDMNARKLCAGTQRGHIRSCKRFAAFLKQSPRPPPLRNGWPSARQSCCRCRTITVDVVPCRLVSAINLQRTLCQPCSSGLLSGSVGDIDRHVQTTINRYPDGTPTWQRP
jgi:hypothetical protein